MFGLEIKLGKVFDNRIDNGNSLLLLLNEYNHQESKLELELEL